MISDKTRSRRDWYAVKGASMVSHFITTGIPSVIDWRSWMTISYWIQANMYPEVVPTFHLISPDNTTERCADIGHRIPINRGCVWDAELQCPKIGTYISYNYRTLKVLVPVLNSETNADNASIITQMEGTVGRLQKSGGIRLPTFVGNAPAIRDGRWEGVHIPTRLSAHTHRHEDH
uniref:Uncharacterized protein n=1 Tax=Lepeophtheirus salmonis TaxID=72036 RepID=A0A0K2TQY8_LEPSM